MKRAKIVHDNLNARGGSERVAFATIELLNKHGFKVDLSTLQMPDLSEIKREFGGDESNLWNFNQIEFLNFNSAIDFRPKDGSGNETNKREEKIKSFKNKFDDNQYDIIINTHGDLFPYYNELDHERTDSRAGSSPIRITYCHYPLVPQLICTRDYSFIERFIESFSELSPVTKDIIAYKILKKYNEMMKKTIVLTNSNFSKHAIEKMYGRNNIQVSVVYPPVEVDKFQIPDALGDSLNAINRFQGEKSKILVISRICPPKHVENVLEIGKLLKENHGLHNFEIDVVGSITPEDKDYAQSLEILISKYDLESNVKINSNVSFKDLQTKVNESGLYLHPTPDEPFGISIVEAMSAGLIPIVPGKGGATEFVPSQYQYNTIADASDLIYKILTNSNGVHDDNDTKYQKQYIKMLANKFSKQEFKKNLLKVIVPLFGNNEISSSPSPQHLVPFTLRG